MRAESPSINSDKIIVDRTKRRSPTARFVKDQRLRIAQNPGKAVEYELELMTSLAENHRNAFIALPIFVAIVAAIASSWVGPVLAAYWFILTFLAYGLMTALSARFLRESGEEGIVASWRRSFLFGQLLLALSWTVFALYKCPTCTDGTYSIIQFSMILVVQAITMILSYGSGASLLVASAPPTLALSARFMLSYEPSLMIMGGILLGAQAFFYLIANRFRLSVLSILSHKGEKETLIAELETARSISEEARRRAEEANLAKSRFLATMSHELRTPLNAILGFSEVMRNEVLGPIDNDSYKEYIADIHTSGEHLLNVINEILDLSRIEAGRHQLNEEAIRLVNVVDDAFHMVQIKAKAKDINIVTQYEDNLPLIWADEKAVRQVTLNLLSNALKFTPQGGTIWLKVGWTSSGGQYLAVKDTGPGIAEEEIPVVLSSFGQGSIAIKSAEQGSGLGLPIVQALVHMHDGKFDLRSKLREGTEVIASFPHSRVLEVMPPVQDDDGAHWRGSSRRRRAG
ncbi:MAG: HAMP domain-containing sensor histidine kinase [Pseudomonadota bacterium]|nr:HAMP domain-containing sensor histidine kinase [Pseudomonadota bacterium]